MTDVDPSRPAAQDHAARWGAYTYFAFAGLALATLLLGYFLARFNKEFEIRFGTDGQFVINVEAGEDLSQILDEAFAKQSSSTENLLSDRGYYSLQGIKLVDALERLNVDLPENAEVTKGIRELLWMQRGPFQPPGSLSGADERLFAALVELEQESRDQAKSNRLLALLWRSSLEQTGFFRPRVFKAEIRSSLAGRAVSANTKEIYACPGNVLVGKTVTIVGHSQAEFRQISGKVADDPFRFPCPDDGASLDALLGGAALKIGLDPITFAELADPTNRLGALPAVLDAVFQVRPADITEPIIPIVN